MSKPIQHIGRVVEVSRRSVRVEIIAESACGSCKARSACGMGEESHKIVDVPTVDAASYAVGERCFVSVARQAGLRAVLLAYCMPLAVLMATLVICTACGVGEGTAAAASLGAVAAYYLAMRLLRNRLETNIIFKIKKL